MQNNIYWPVFCDSNQIFVLENGWKHPQIWIIIKIPKSILLY